MTLATILLRQVLLRDLRIKLLVVAATKNVDLGHSDWVQELLDDAENARETPRRIDDVQATETLRVVVLTDARRLLQVPVDTGRLHEPHALQVHDCATSLEQVSGLARAGGQTRIGHLLVLDHEVLQHAVVAGDLAHGFEVDVAERFDVKRSSVLVGLVVVLRVVLEDLRLLFVVEVGDEGVESATEGRPPLLAIDEPDNSKLASCAYKA